MFRALLLFLSCAAMVGTGGAADGPFYSWVPRGETAPPAVQVLTHDLFHSHVNLMIWNDGKILWSDDPTDLFSQPTLPQEGSRLLGFCYYEANIGPEAVARALDAIDDDSPADLEKSFEIGVCSGGYVFVDLTCDGHCDSLGLLYPWREKKEPRNVYIDNKKYEALPGETKLDVIARLPEKERAFRRVADRTLDILFSLIPDDPAVIRELGPTEFDWIAAAPSDSAD